MVSYPDISPYAPARDERDERFDPIVFRDSSELRCTTCGGIWGFEADRGWALRNWSDVWRIRAKLSVEAYCEVRDRRRGSELLMEGMGMDMASVTIWASR